VPLRAVHGEEAHDGAVVSPGKKTACGQLRWVELARAGLGNAQGCGEHGCKTNWTAGKQWRGNGGELELDSGGRKGKKRRMATGSGT
jgi:hypothetical protein